MSNEGNIVTKWIADISELAADGAKMPDTQAKNVCFSSIIAYCAAVLTTTKGTDRE